MTQDPRTEQDRTDVTSASRVPDVPAPPAPEAARVPPVAPPAVVAAAPAWGAPAAPADVAIPPAAPPAPAPGAALPGDDLPPVPRRSADPLPPPEPDEGPEPDPREQRRAGRRRLAMTAFALLGVLLVLLTAAAWWALVRREAPGVPAGRQVTVVVSEGADVGSIAKKLARAGVVNNANMFLLSVRLAGAGDEFRSGSYQLSTGMPDDAVIDSLAVGPQSEGVMVTIPEGYTVRQIARRLEQKAGVPAAEFTELALKHGREFRDGHEFLKDNTTPSLEGFLFPKTYAIRKGADPREVIDIMLGQFEKEIGAVDMSYARSKNLNVHDVVTIASMIERETRVAKERRLVASVVYNRLKQDMRLQICSTVLYAQGRNSGTVLYKDLQVDSAYNTYRIDGLPPGPIASPGIAALDAATHPTDTRYLYYVLTGRDGTHTFATNSADFEKARTHEVR